MPRLSYVIWRKPTLQFIRTATNHSRYWHRYNHSTECCYVEELQKLAKASRNLNAPSLFELIVRHPFLRGVPLRPGACQ